jgi:hypothetical protein
LADNDYTSDYIKSIDRYRDTLIKAVEIATDGFKAPELTVEASAEVVSAAFTMQVEYRAMLLAGERKRA